MKRIILGLFISLLLISCSSNKNKIDEEPAWINNPKALYPDGLYLSAVGYGSSRRAAESDAMGSIARIFKTEIKAEDKFTERLKEISINDESQVSMFAENEKSISMHAEEDLINIEIGETYVNKLGRVYCLAYINRSNTADIYAEKIQQIENKINYYLSKSDATDSYYLKYSYLTSAVALAHQNKVLLEQLSIISIDDYELIRIRDKTAEVEAILGQVASEISFSISFADDENGFFENTVSQVINDLNFNVVQEGSMIEIIGNVDYQQVKLDRSEKFYKYDFILKLQDNQGNVVASLNKKGRAGSISYSEAKNKAKRLVQKDIESNLERKILNYFDSLVK